MDVVSKASGIPSVDIVDMELQLIDIQPSAIGGACDDLLFSGRLDNLCSSYQAIRALADGSSGIYILIHILMHTYTHTYTHAYTRGSIIPNKCADGMSIRP